MITRVCSGLLNHLGSLPYMQMNAMVSTLLLLVGALQVGEVRQFEVEGVKRQALVVEPKGAGKPALVLGFHGFGGNMRNAARSFAIHYHWPEALVVYPQGLEVGSARLPDSPRRPGWQNLPGAQEDRDLRFVDRILLELKGRYDPKRVFAMGHSNGGRYTYVL
ncbi:MAG TPA: hypothetical protein VM328_11180, partial [Fimbriimonadaceae bacterium]|nr:hypothetical protein [Fimbriimonadaceae bacterium]